jgi:hypothetical protein
MRHLFFILLTGILYLGCNDKDKKSYHRPATFILQKMTIEVQPVNGRSLDGKEISRVKGELQSHGVCAIESITLIRREAFSISKSSWTNDDLIFFRDTYQTLFDASATDREMTIFMAHLSGNAAESKDIAGLAFSRQFIVFFDNGPGNDAQSAIMLHEIGHTMGLVDPDKRGELVNKNNPIHCISSNCIMWPIAFPLASFDYLCDQDLREMEELGPRAATLCQCSAY